MRQWPIALVTLHERRVLRSPFVAACLLACVLSCTRTKSVREEMLAVSGDVRPTPGQLSGETGYRPWSRATRDPQMRNRLHKVSARKDPRSDPDRALLDLLHGNTERAVATLKVAAQDRLTAPDVLTDLSAAYLLRYEETGDCVDLLRAHDAAERSLALAPGNHASLFNRAQALTLLGTRSAAKRAWEKVQGQRQDGWSAEAAAATDALRAPTIDDAWNAELRRLPGHSPPMIQAATERFPWHARRFAEEVLLPRWASELASGEEAKAAQTFRLASAIGAALERVRGESLTNDAVQAAGRVASGASRSERHALLRGLRGFGDGVAQFNDQNLVAARKSLTQAAGDLAAARNPLQYWARFYVALDDYYLDASRGLAALDVLLETIPADRYPALTGRICWIGGTADKVQGRMQSSVRRYERAAASLRRAGGETAAAFALVLLAESYSLLGEEALAWQSRRSAFAAVPLAEGPRYNIAMWTEATNALSREGNAHLAGPLLEEAVADADRWEKPFGHATAYTYRAGYWMAVGKRKEALADIRAARAAIGKLEENSLRDYLNYRVLIPEALCEMETAPAHAAELLQRSLDGQGATGTRFDDITYTTDLARAQLAAGKITDGAATLERAIALFEEIRSTVEDPVSRMHAFRQAQPAFDRLIDLRVTSLPDDGEAFLLAERSRARFLLEMADRRRGSASSGSFATLGEIRTALPPGTALASYAVLDDRILVWVVTRHRSQRVQLTAKPRELENAVERFRLELTRADDEGRIRDAAVPLYDSLIRPLGLTPEDGSLIIVPDRWLARLPFAALFDRASGRHLIEQRTVAIAPGATLLLRGKPLEVRPREEATSVVFGVARHGEYHGVPLPPLAQADKEAKAVASAYRGSVLMRGGDATRENFLRMSLSADVIHFAGHAVADLHAPRRSVLLFASPSGGLEPLFLGELFDAGARTARLVVLSACRGQDSLANEREGVLGLAGAFVAGGVAEVLASPVDVADDLVPPLMAAFHRHYRQRGSARLAYRDAVLELLQSPNKRFRSPAAWGGFTVIEGGLEGGRNEI
jgi:CHAT domain-containing protein